MSLLEISQLKKSFLAPDGSTHVVVDVASFTMPDKEQLAVKGESGSGKTTFLNLIAGILKPDTGKIKISGEEISALREPARDRLRATTIGYIFQTFNLLQGYTCLENVLLGMSFGAGADKAYAEKLLRRVGLGDRLKHYPRQLSTGQQQRVAVARALAGRPKLVLADEPTGNLDHKNAAEVLTLIREICRENSAALLLVSHDREVLGAFAGLCVDQSRGPGGCMTIVRIVYKSLRQHAFSTVLTALCVALAGGLLMAVWAVKDQSKTTFTGVNAGYDAVLGARGSKLQLVLNAIFHLEASPGNLPWSDYLEIKKNPAVELAVPLAVGDNYRGYRLAGTMLEFFTKSEFAHGKHFVVQPGGMFFDETRREAVVGNFAAKKLGLKIGDKFHPFHGLIFDEQNQHAETYVVVGILEPSNTPADRVIWIPVEGIQVMSGHDPKAAEDISAVLVKLKAGAAAAGFSIDTKYNKEGNRLTFAWPIGRIMAELFDKIGWFSRILELISYLVAFVGTVSIVVSIYNSMNERRREIAIMRALGAHRGTILSAIILEAASISALGMFFGFIIYAGIMGVVANIVRAQTGVVLDPFQFNPVMLWAPALLIGLGALSGLLPGWKAYRTDVAANLTPLS